MTATVQSIPASTCGHRSVVFDVGTLRFMLSEITDARPDTFEEARDIVLMILRNQYLSRRAAGRTQAQALNDLINYVVRI